MSGGSYNYLYLQGDNGVEPWVLTAMADRLDRLGEKEAAEITRSFLPPSDDHPIRQLWHAVEWRDSNDWGDDQLQEAINKYKREATQK